MPDITGAPSSSTYVRWTTLLVVMANIAFIAVFGNLGGSPTFAEVVAEYGNTFVPAGFAKGISGVILAAFLLFYMAALWPRKHRRRIYDKLVLPLALTSVLASCWYVAFRRSEFGISTALIAGGVVLGALMFVRVASVSPGKHSSLLRVPFSLHFGAMTLALLVAVPQWLNISGLLAGTAIVPDDVAAVFLAIAAAAGGFVALRYGDVVYPAVITSGVGAMFIAQRGYDHNVAADAFIVCIGMLVVVGLAALALAQQPRRDPKGKTSRRSAKMVPTSKREKWSLIDENTSIMRL
ncbi:MAG: hypothetical protein ABI607_06690 [Betaproteobacteria bacterium]